MQGVISERLSTADGPTIRQAIELLLSLDDAALTAGVLSDVRPAPGWENRVTLALSGHFPDHLPPQRRATLSEDEVGDLWCLEGIGHHRFSLQLRGPADLTTLPPMPGLRTLRLDNLDAATLGGLHAQPRLRTLHVGGCRHLLDLDLHNRFPRLENLHLRHNRALRTVRGLDTLPGLRQATLAHCPQLNLTPATLPGLRALSLSHSLGGVPLSLPALRHLRLNRLKEPVSLAGLGLRSLETLRVEQCDVTDLGELAGAPLRRLVLHPRQLTDLSGLSGVAPIAHVDIEGRAVALKSLAGLESQPRIERLSLRRCRSLIDISALRGKQVRVLGLHNARALRDLEPLGTLQGTESLALSAIWPRRQGRPSSLETLGISRLTELKRLSIQHSGRLGSLKGIEAMAGLEHLSVEGCRALKHWSGLDSLRQLESLSTLKCPWAGANADLQRGPAVSQLVERLLRDAPARSTDIHRLGLGPFSRLSASGLHVCRRMTLHGLHKPPPLSRAVHLEELTLGYTFEIDLATLGRLPALRCLTLHRTGRVDLAGLAAFAPGLLRLRLSGCFQAKLDGVSACTGLRWLALSGTRIDGDLGLASLPDLVAIECGGDRHGLWSQQMPPGVKTLTIRGATHFPITPPSWADQIEVLVMTGGGRQSCLEKMAVWRNTRDLRLENTTVTDVSGLLTLFPRLERADLRGSQLPVHLRRVMPRERLARLA